MKKLAVSVFALFAMTNASSASECWSAVQNWQSGNQMTCKFDSRLGRNNSANVMGITGSGVLGAEGFGAGPRSGRGGGGGDDTTTTTTTTTAS